MQPCVPRSWAGISNFIEDVLGSWKGLAVKGPNGETKGGYRMSHHYTSWGRWLY